jgi:hypothetical protein
MPRDLRIHPHHPTPNPFLAAPSILNTSIFLTNLSLPSAPALYSLLSFILSTSLITFIPSLVLGTYLSDPRT